ncbi:MAG: RHS repeat protein [Candidatus Hydrogenedentes bacterium]|nr:RHS repeat protein [Candidatus Hydrogenedentota bacterium]
MTKVIDAEANETTLEYDLNGNLTKVTDALLVETDYEYDALNHLTKIVSPSGSGIYMGNSGTDYEFGAI